MARWLLALLLMSQTAFAAKAVWTGEVRYVTTLTHRQGIKCRYQYAGEFFWKTFAKRRTCPRTVEVE